VDEEDDTIVWEFKDDRENEGCLMKLPNGKFELWTGNPSVCQVSSVELTLTDVIGLFEDIGLELGRLPSE